jgi:hypothetical protein
MDGNPLPPGVHVILGDSAAAIFRRAFRPAPGQLLIDRDVLSCGPTAQCPSVEAWESMRGNYWRGVVPAVENAGPLPGLDLAEIAQRLQAAERVTLWTSTSVSEQLFIAHMIHRTHEAGGDIRRIRWVRFDQVAGTGELDEARMAAHPEPAAIPAPELSDYRDAWAALTSPDPAVLERFEDTHPQANPWLKRAMRLLMRRYPEKHTGLPWWDFTLLSEVPTHGPEAARVIGSTIADYWDEGDFVGDWYLFARLLRLADPRLPRPLLDVQGNRADMRACRVTLTPFGIEVLECRAPNYPANPIDDWASGVRLSSADQRLWFREDGKLVRG